MSQSTTIKPTSSSSSSSSHHHHHHHKRPSSAISSSSATDGDSSNGSSASSVNDFLCSLRYDNTLPDLPFEPKFMKIQTDFSKFTNYKSTSLERNYKQQLLTDPHMGIPIDLIDLSQYASIKSTANGNNNGAISSPFLTKDDQILLKSIDSLSSSTGQIGGVGGDSLANESAGVNGSSMNGGSGDSGSPSIFLGKSDNSSRKTARASLRPSVAWLRKTEYLSTNETLLGRPTKRQSVGNSPSSSSPILNQNQSASSATGEPEKDVELVENTFYNIKNASQFVHPSGRTDIKPVSILPVFPDFDMWSNSYTEVSFDADPLDLPPASLKGQDFSNYITKQQSIRNKGIIRGITDKFVYFIAPKNELDDVNNNNNNNNRDGDNDDTQGGSTGDYKMYRVFTNDIFVQENNENYFMIVKDDAVYYNRLNTRVNLKRVKSRDDKILEKRTIGRPEYVTYNTRELTEEEKEDKAIKLQKLLEQDKSEFNINLS